MQPTTQAPSDFAAGEEAHVGIDGPHSAGPKIFRGGAGGRLILELGNFTFLNLSMSFFANECLMA